ncbi:MAG: hypothetical protein IIA51_01280 [Chloroflexi bacterium]|nr:hypothetical protein [Chloroflexota bacterium]
MANFWDGSRLGYLQDGRQLNENYTWRNDTDPFNPGALDRIIYLDSVLSVENAFVLLLIPCCYWTRPWLRVDDVVLDAQSGYYDHLPIVVDLLLPTPREPFP